MEWTALCGRLHTLKTQLPQTIERTFRSYVVLGGMQPNASGDQVPITNEELEQALQDFQAAMQTRNDILMGVMIEESHVVVGDYEEPIWLLYCNQYPRFPQKEATIELYVCELALFMLLRFKQERISVTLPDNTLVYDAADIPSYDVSRDYVVDAHCRPEEQGSEESKEAKEAYEAGLAKGAKLRKEAELRKRAGAKTVNDGELVVAACAACGQDYYEGMSIFPGGGQCPQCGNELPDEPKAPRIEPGDELLPIEDTPEDSDPCAGCPDFDDCESRCIDPAPPAYVIGVDMADGGRPSFSTVEAVANPEPGMEMLTEGAPADVPCVTCKGDCDCPSVYPPPCDEGN